MVTRGWFVGKKLGVMGRGSGNLNFSGVRRVDGGVGVGVKGSKISHFCGVIRVDGVGGCRMPDWAGRMATD